jgi:hypothetical protein
MIRLTVVAASPAAPADLVEPACPDRECGAVFAISAIVGETLSWVISASVLNTCSRGMFIAAVIDACSS